MKAIVMLCAAAILAASFLLTQSWAQEKDKPSMPGMQMPKSTPKPTPKPSPAPAQTPSPEPQTPAQKPATGMGEMEMEETKPAQGEAENPPARRAASRTAARLARPDHAPQPVGKVGVA